MVAEHAARRVVSPILVGRDRELDRLAAAVAAPPSVSVVEGEAGIGKSRLVAELEGRPEVAGRRWLKGGCGQIREPFPLGPIVEALRGWGPELAGAALSPVAGTLRALLPELGHVLPAAPAALDDRAAERHRVFRGLTEVLAALGPAVLVVEDLHWADEQTAEFLAYLMAGLPGSLSVVLTYRGEEASAGVRALAARPADLITCEHVTLAPLDTEQTRALAAAIMDTKRVTAEFAAHLCGRASGLPLAIQELLALLRTRGTLIQWEGGWARRALDSLDVPAGIRVTMQERVARLPAAARAAAEAAAVLHVATPAAVLAEVAELPDLGAIDELLASGLCAEDNGMVGFRHVLAAQAVYEGLPLGRRQALHALASRAVRGLRPVPLGQVAHHLRQAGRAAEWAEAAVHAADQATALGDDVEAARLLEEVVRHADPAPARRAELTVRLGWAAIEVLRTPQVVELISEALRHDLPRPIRGELWLLLALHLETTRTDHPRQRHAFSEAVADLTDRPDLAAWAMIGLGMPWTSDVPPAEHTAWLERALDTLPAIDDPAARLLVLGKATMVFVALGDPRWAELTERVEQETNGRAVLRRAANAYKSIGEDACYSGHHEVARRLLSTGLDGAASSHAPEFRCRAMLVVLDYCTGSWKGLDREIEDLRRAFGDRPSERNAMDSVGACLAPAPGRIDAALDLLREVIRRARSMGDFDLLPLTVTMLLRLGTARGQAAEVLAETAPAVDSWEGRHIWPIGVRALPALVEALLAAGSMPAAADLVSKYTERLRGLDAPLAVPSLAHARGLLAAHEREWERAAREFAASAAAFDRLPARYEAAQAREQVAVCMSAMDDPAAGQMLSTAIAVYADLGAGWDLDRAIRLGRRWGLRPSAPRGDATDKSGLSARQGQVARLAAIGLTNQEIAKEMFLSPKTVDKHLSAAMRKVGARSRTELARHIGEFSP
ncbi:helix-turn-helix transcriptional regulator [Nonomuraea sp. NPDC004297]